MSQHLVLNRTGDKMPLVGFGCWKVDPQDAEDTIYNAIKAGVRLIDGAGDYGNEIEVGRGINKAINEGVVKREELFVVTKIWNTFHAKENVRPTFEKQLKDLGLDYVDLYLIHFPVPLKHVAIEAAYPPGWYQPGKSDDIEFERSPIQDLWREMEKIAESGAAKNIGISNFNVQLILDLLTYANIKPAVLQVELHPYLQQTRLVEWVQKQGIQVTAYSSFGPASFIQLTDDGKTAEPLLGHPVIKEIAEKHGKSTAQVLLRWSLERNVAVIPKSMNVERTKSNLDIFSFSLSKDEVAAIGKLELGLRFNDPFSYGFGLPLFC
ncbi:4-dihydromethyltrisporate dehydrogenase [Zychaea mexicana]|uniref:4-dihydromethyltrisporate dehydrogenase n=1 Tax=Zychaea mexicana TaxID=64656 RepID=UPI0022FDBCA4|nr:4-dihydromethyltrisporate dehydrogenase [Zychaea mexicana]KAI9494778.1 4-dihydromethyltrisporate dehydrogenase [Zychaea mexicana]